MCTFVGKRVQYWKAGLSEEMVSPALLGDYYLRKKFEDAPDLLVYVPLSRSEVQQVFREGGKISDICADPTYAMPLDVDEEDA